MPAWNAVAAAFNRLGGELQSQPLGKRRGGDPAAPPFELWRHAASVALQPKVSCCSGSAHPLSP
eukprot:123609-Chlamydomonas_euryale.AAC.4